MPKLPLLRHQRERQSLSQEELAKAAGVSRATVTRLEKGYAAFPATARKVAQALGVRPADLMDPSQR
jgi:transcriptional regulator with XRE-family HTH domain